MAWIKAVSIPYLDNMKVEIPEKHQQECELKVDIDCNGDYIVTVNGEEVSYTSDDTGGGEA